MNFYKSKRWKRKRGVILRRDEYLCRQCKRYGKTTQASTVHHINPLEVSPELALINDNLVSLCNSCHELMHDRVNDRLTHLGTEWLVRVGALGRTTTNN